MRLVLEALPIALHPLDQQMAYAVGLLLPLTKPFGLSFGDRACLVLARRLGVQVLTADRAWRDVGRVAGVDVVVIR